MRCCIPRARTHRRTCASSSTAMAAPATRRVRMFDDLRAYPGSVHIIVSGTAAFSGDSAGDSSGPSGNDARLAVDDPRRPSVAAWGNERDLEEAVRLLRGVQGKHPQRLRPALPQAPAGEISAMMRDTTWMDAGRRAARTGFIDGIVDMGRRRGQHRPPATKRASRRPRQRWRHGWSARAHCRCAKARRHSLRPL